MTNENLIAAANAGDESAQEEFYSKLSVRFFRVITRELQKYPILKDGINLEQKSQEVCQYAIDEVKKLCPLRNPGFSLMQVMNVLHNILDTVVTNALADLAKRGNKEAENLLFDIIRKKLLERIMRRKGRNARAEK